jgi:hypothetical protein
MLKVLERMKFDGDLHRARHLEHTGRNVSVEGDLAVGQVGDEHDPMARAERHRLLEEA